MLSFLKEFYDNPRDEMDGSEKIDVTTYFYVRDAIVSLFGQTPDGAEGGTLINEIINYIKSKFAKADTNVFKVVNDIILWEATYNFGQLEWYESDDELPENCMDVIEGHLKPARQVYINVGSVLPDADWCKYFNVTVKNNKADITNILNELLEDVTYGKYVELRYSDLDDIAYDYAREREDIESSDEEAANWWYHG